MNRKDLEDLVVIPVRVPKSVKDSLDALSRADGIPTATYCRTVLIHHVQEPQSVEKIKWVEKGPPKRKGSKR